MNNPTEFTDEELRAELERVRESNQNLLTRVKGLEAALDTERAEVEVQRGIVEKARRITSFDSIACPLCTYHNGNFIAACGPHQDWMRAEAEVSKLRAEVERLTDSRRKLLDEVEHHRAEVERLKAERDDEMAEVERLTKLTDLLTRTDNAVRAEADAEVNRLRAEVEQLTDSRRKLLDEVEHHRAEVEQLKREREEARNRVNVVALVWEDEVERLRAQLRDVATRQCRAIAAALKKNGLHGFVVEIALATPLVTDAPGESK